MMSSPALSLNTIVSAITCLCSGNPYGVSNIFQSELHNLTSELNVNQSLYNSEKTLIDEQLHLNAKMEQITKKLSRLEEEKCDTCNPCGNLVPNTEQQRYIKLEKRSTDIYCLNDKTLGDGWHVLLKTPNIRELKPWNLSHVEEGFQYDFRTNIGYFMGLDTLYQLTKGIDFELVVRTERHLGKWSQFAITDQTLSYEIKNLGEFRGSGELNTLSASDGVPATDGILSNSLFDCTDRDSLPKCLPGKYLKDLALVTNSVEIFIRRTSAYEDEGPLLAALTKIEENENE